MPNSHINTQKQKIYWITPIIFQAMKMTAAAYGIGSGLKRTTQFR